MKDNKNVQKETNYIHSHNNHSNCHCHGNCQHNNMNQPINKSYKSDYIKEKLIFIPLIVIKLLISAFIYKKYFINNLENEVDINYSHKVFPFFIIHLLIIYFLSVFSSSTQTNIDKYTNLNTNNNSKKELITFRQNYLLCDFCHRVKFIRTSHCRLCDKCISNRDHHCPFITNCVGFNNMQYFLNFCFWMSYGLIIYIYSFLKFQYINLSIIKMIIFKIDFIANILFLLSSASILIRGLLTIYNNRTYLESMRQIGIETKCPFYDCLKKSNQSKVNNMYNIGFLNHFYYLVGPTLLHLILPLPKFKNFILDENCPIFSKIKFPDRIQILKYYNMKNPNYFKEQIEETSNPDEFIKKCHQYYDDKNII